jgi:hypothetical protein
MSDHGALAHCDEAIAFIDQIKDPVTRTLVNMAFIQFVLKAHTGKREPPQGDLDMLYVVTVLEGFFAEHEVIARALRGERVGAWFEEAEIGQSGSA